MRTVPSPLIFVLCFLWPHLLLGQETRISLDQALIRALDRDPTLKKIYADVMGADGSSTEVRADLRPQVHFEVEGGYGRRERTIEGLTTGGPYILGERAGLVVEQLIWDNGVSSLEWKDKKQQAEATRLLYEAEREATAFNTIEVYLRLFRTRKQVKLAWENLNVHAEYLNIATERAKGIGDEADVKLATSRKKLAEVLIKERKLEVLQAEAAFERYVGDPPPERLLYPHVPEIHTIYDVKIKDNYHYQAILLHCQAAQLARKAISKSNGPKIKFRGTGSYGEDMLGLKGPDEELSALLVVDWNLIQGWRLRGQKEQASGAIARQVSLADETKTLLLRDFNHAWADYTTLRDRELYLWRYRKGLNETEWLYRKQFMLGKRPLMGMLDIAAEKVQSEIDLVDHQYERDVNSYRLLSFGGRVIPYTLGKDYIKCEPEYIDMECPGGGCLSQSDPFCPEICETQVCESAKATLVHPNKVLLRRLFKKDSPGYVDTSGFDTVESSIPLPNKESGNGKLRGTLGRLFKKRSTSPPYQFEK